MTAPTEAAPQVVQPAEVGAPNGAGEAPIRFPVLALEGFDTSDGRYLSADALTPRAFPISLLAVAESPHGGQDSAAAVIVGRITSATRVPGPEVLSTRTGQPFPEGAFVWSAEGMISTDAEVPVGNGSVNAYELVKSGRLRGVSVDLAGMDYEEISDVTFDADNPRRQLIVHSAEIAAATLVPIPAFADAYAELPAETTALPDPATEGLTAAAWPAWRSAEVGDYPALTAAAGADAATVSLPADAAGQLAEFIAAGEGEPRDAADLAAAIVEWMGQTWQPNPAENAPDTAAEPVTAAADEDVTVEDDSGDGDGDEVGEDTGLPDAPQDCEFGDHPATQSLLFDDDTKYLPVCDDDEQQGRDLIGQNGATVTRVVEIREQDRLNADEEVLPQ